jgi:hypothetical protein
MPKPLSVSGYPQHILTIAERIGRGEQVEFRDASKVPLSAIRFDFYGFRKAVEREQLGPIFPKLKAITITLKPEYGQWVLRFEDMDATYAATLVNSQLGIEPRASAPTSGDSPPEEPRAEPRTSTESERLIEELYGPKREKGKS